MTEDHILNTAFRAHGRLNRMHREGWDEAMEENWRRVASGELDNSTAVIRTDPNAAPAKAAKTQPR